MRLRWLLVCMLPFACPATSTSEPSSFWKTWGDGNAEINAYDLTQPRYNELRKGRAVLIYVAEPQTRSTRVKPDKGNHPEGNIKYVLKQIHMRDFRTGIYPYCINTGTFIHVDPEGKRPRGSVSKVSFASREWCGVTFHQLLFFQDEIRSQSFSYFDGEADQDLKTEYPKDALVGDALFTSVRSLFGELVGPGQTRELAYLPTLARVRLDHKPLEWSKIKVSRSSKPKKISVPAGDFEVDVYTFDVPDHPQLTIYVESKGQKRVIKWQAEDGEMGEMIGSQRMQYWKLNKLGDEALLSKLGL
jgi:hypothetical protein